MYWAKFEAHLGHTTDNVVIEAESTQGNINSKQKGTGTTFYTCTYVLCKDTFKRYVNVFYKNTLI